ncbi:MAG: disulfide oxidoreductase [bacterium]|nr:disulfide oxidoreductase [bacterium]
MSKKQINLLYLIFALSLTGTLGSLYFSEIQNLLPCLLCWYQRIALYPIVIISAVAILNEDTKAHRYILPLAILGFGIALYQNLLIWGIVPESTSGCTGGVSCTQPTISWLGFITIPILSLTAFAGITGLAWIFPKMKKDEQQNAE